jgi:dnd system-associated protein 4
MALNDSGYPQFIRVDTRIKKDYLEKLVAKNNASCFAGQELGEVYLLAAAIGSANNTRLPSRERSDVRLYRSLSDNYKLLIRAIAISASNYDVQVVLDGGKTLKIVEEFANGGLKILYDKIFDAGLKFSIEDEVLKLLEQRSSREGNASRP